MNNIWCIIINNERKKLMIRNGFRTWSMFLIWKNIVTLKYSVWQWNISRNQVEVAVVLVVDIAFICLTIVIVQLQFFVQSIFSSKKGHSLSILDKNCVQRLLNIFLSEKEKLYSSDKNTRPYLLLTFLVWFRSLKTTERG